MKLLLTPIEAIIGVETEEGCKSLPHFLANLDDPVFEDENGGEWVEAEVCLSPKGTPSSADIEEYFEGAIKILQRVDIPLATVAFGLPNAGAVYVLIARRNGGDEEEG